MKRVFFLFLLIPVSVWGQRFQLAPPQLKADSAFFLQSARINMAFDLDSASIRYTLDGSYPKDSSLLYSQPVVLQNSCVVRARSMCPGFIASSLAEQQVVKVSAVPDSARLLTAPDTLYPGKYVATLFNLLKGSHELKDGQWMGFRSDSVVVIEAYFKKPTTCNILNISTLFDSGAWAFPPSRIEVLGASGDKEWRSIGLWAARDAAAFRKDKPAKYDMFQKVILRKTEVDRLQIRIIPFGPLPDWHSGTGKPAWLFLDEIAIQ